jgi:hypothetical protein
MNESGPYKLDLLRFSADFQRRAKHQIWRESSISKAEQRMFVGFYFVRKLIEGRKVTDACARSSALVGRATLRRSREVSDFKREDLEKDLGSAEFAEAAVDVNQLCDKVVHAWWCIPMQNENGGLAGYIFTTDKKRNAELWSLPSQSIIDLFARFGENDISSLRMERTGNGRLIYWRAE